MKYVIRVQNSNNSHEKDGVTIKGYINIGDNIMGVAMQHVLLQIGIPKCDMVYMNAVELSEYRGEELIYPIAFPASFNLGMHSFNRLSHDVRPVFLGVHFLGDKIPDEEEISFLKKQQPIGCRDRYTAYGFNGMKELGVQCYVNGCVTATLAKREPMQGRGKIFFVDVPKGILPLFPYAEFGSYDIVHMSHSLLDTVYPTNEEYLAKAGQVLQCYKENAELVVTSRLHCALPCMAFGIPVVLVRENYINTFSAIDHVLPLYTLDKWHTISWRPKPVSYEEIKVKMIALAKLRMFGGDAREIAELSAEIERFWGGETLEMNYSYYRERLKKDLRREMHDEFRYAIWGIGGLGVASRNAVNSLLPNAQLAFAVDTYKSGQFMGKPVLKPEELAKYPDVFVFCCSSIGEKAICAYLSDLGRRYGYEYISFAPQISKIPKE